MCTDWMLVPLIVHVVPVERDGSHAPQPEPLELLGPEGSQKKRLRTERKNDPFDETDLVRH